MTRAETTPAPEADVEPRAAASSSRRRLAGILLAAGGLTLAAAEIVHPRGGDDVFAVSLAQSRPGWTAWGLLIMATALLQLPGVLAYRAGVPRGRGYRLTAVGGGTLGAALVALFAFGQFHAEGATMVGEVPVPPDVLAAFARTDSAPSLGITAVLALFGFHLGWPLLFAGLARARHLPTPLGIIGGASTFLCLFGAALGPVGETLLFVLAAACIAAAGLCLARSRGPAPR